MEEIWKPVVGYEGLYEVSNLGNVRGKNGMLKPQARKHGYLSVWLYGNGGTSKRNGKQFSVHRIVATAFIPNPSGLSEVNHKDECKTNNCAENLEWCSHRQNSVYGTRGKRIGGANTNGKKSIRIAQYTLDGKLVRVFQSLQEANRCGFAAGNICKCAQGKSNYSHAYGYKWRYANTDNRGREIS